MKDEKIGIMVNEVREVLKIRQEDIEKVSMETGDGVVGILQLEDRLVNYIDLDLII